MPITTEYAKYFMDPELNHSSGYFQTPETSLDDAQRAKVTAILDACRIEPGMRLLDVGCGWGATARAAARDYGASVVAITIEDDHLSYALEAEKDQVGASRIDYRLQRWEDFDEPVDRIVCINAFENFTEKKAFLEHCRRILPEGGVMVMLAVTAQRPMFRVVSRQQVITTAEEAGFDVDVSESLADHYVRTLEHYCANITAHLAEVASFRGADRAKEDIEWYETCAEFLRTGMNDMFEFTFTARAERSNGVEDATDTRSG